MALPWEETAGEPVNAQALHPATEAVLQDAALDVQVTDVAEPRQAKRIRVSLAYRNTSGLLVEPISLVAWKFSPGGAE